MHTETGVVMGYSRGTAPPVGARAGSGPRTDIFSLGVVLYDRGAHPFRGATPAATFDALSNREPSAPVISNPEVSPELERVIGRALEKNRELRYQTASDLRAELKRCQRTLDSAPSTWARGRVSPGECSTRHVGHSSRKQDSRWQCCSLSELWLLLLCDAGRRA